MYNNQFMPYYQPQGNQMQSLNQQYFNQQTQQNDSDRIFVANANAAEAYLVTAGGFVRLWDSSKNRFYEKSADMSGRQYPMRTFEYTECNATETATTNDIEKRVKILEEKLNAMVNTTQREVVQYESTNK